MQRRLRPLLSRRPRRPAARGLQGRAAQRLCGAAAAAGDGGGAGSAHGHRLCRAHRHDRRPSHTVQLVARVQGYLARSISRTASGSRRAICCSRSSRTPTRRAAAGAVPARGASQAQLRHAQTEFDRYSGLFKQKAASAVDVDTWRANRDQAQAGLLGAQAQLELAQINLGYTTVTAPFDGRMGRHLIDAGNLVGTDGRTTVLAEINQIDPIYAYFTINERDLLRIRAERQSRHAARTTRCSSSARCRGRLPAPGQARLRRHHADPGHRHARAARRLPNPDLRAAARACSPGSGSPSAASDVPARAGDGDRPRPGRPLRADRRCDRTGRGTGRRARPARGRRMRVVERRA